jgi:hypothetical protein
VAKPGFGDSSSSASALLAAQLPFGRAQVCCIMVSVYSTCSDTIASRTSRGAGLRIGCFSHISTSHSHSLLHSSAYLRLGRAAIYVASVAGSRISRPQSRIFPETSEISR